MNFRISSLPRFSPETPGVVPGISQLTLSDRFAKAVLISPLPNAAQVSVTKDFFCSFVMIVLLRIECTCKFNALEMSTDKSCRLPRLIPRNWHRSEAVREG